MRSVTDPERLQLAIKPERLQLAIKPERLELSADNQIQPHQAQALAASKKAWRKFKCLICGHCDRNEPVMDLCLKCKSSDGKYLRFPWWRKYMNRPSAAAA